MTSDDPGETRQPAAPPKRPVAIPPAIVPECWDDYDGFRETFLADFTVPEHNAALRRLCDVLSALIGEADRVMPKSPEGWYRTQIRAALADLRFLQGYLTETAEGGVWNIPAGDEALARLVRRKVKALGKIADAIEGALGLVTKEVSHFVVSRALAPGHQCPGSEQRRVARGPRGLLTSGRRALQ